MVLQFSINQAECVAQGVWLTRSWDYRVLKNNCQHFASYLIQTLTRQEIYPRTISDLMRNFVPWSHRSAPTPLQSMSVYTAEPQRHTILPRKPLNTRETEILGWLTSGSISPNHPPIPAPPFAGLGVSRLQLDGFRSLLQDGEREHLDTLRLGEPQLLQDYFFVSDPSTSNRVSRAVGVLYREVFLLCRYVQSGSIRSWDYTHGSGSGVLNSLEETEKLFVYGYIYPRNINKVIATRVGTVLLELL
jgi:hypothetical protein